MSKFLVETFYTCTFKIVHKLEELNEKNLSELENRNDGKVEVIDVKLNNRKTKTLNKNDNSFLVKSESKNIPDISSVVKEKINNSKELTNSLDEKINKSQKLNKHVNNRCPTEEKVIFKK